MAELVYNGISLPFLSTQQVAYEPVYDESGADYMFTRVVIDCTAVITSNVSPANSPETVTAAMARISHMLNTPRRGLTFKVGGVTLLSQVAASGNTTAYWRDAKNGPNPQARISQIVGTECMMVAFRVETCVVDCPEAGSSLYVSHRWTETHDVDELAYTRRTRNGRIVTQANLLGNADQLRALVAPPLEPDFRRVSSHYQLQSDGLVLTYEFVDQEVYLMPPNPSGKAEGRFSLTSKDGASYFAECYLRLQGGKPTDKTVLMIRAISLALSKIQASTAPGTLGSVAKFATYSEDMFANDVSVRLSAQVTPATAVMRAGDKNVLPPTGVSQSPAGGNGAGGAIGQPTPTRPDGKQIAISTVRNFEWLKIPEGFFDGSGRRFDPGDRGTANLLMIANALSDPCLRQTVLTGTGQTAALQTATGTTVPASISIMSFVPPGQPSYRSFENDGIYETYTVDQRTVTDQNIIALPVGRAGAAAAIIQTAAPIARKRIEWRAIKIGGTPRIPDPNLIDTNWVLANHQVLPEQVEPTADGSVLRYIVSGCYDYVARNANLVTLAASLPPWVDASAAGPASQPLLYTKGILEPGQSVITTTGQPPAGPFNWVVPPTQSNGSSLSTQGTGQPF